MTRRAVLAPYLNSFLLQVSNIDVRRWSHLSFPGSTHYYVFF